MIRARQYGATILKRGTCTSCKDPCLICKDGKSSCCNAEVHEYSRGSISKETISTRKRRGIYLNKKEKETILNEQENKCFWCGMQFDTYVLSPQKKIYQLKPCWDHYIPFVYSGSNQKDQFVAACSRCNSKKSSYIILNSFEEEKLKKYLANSFDADGWVNLTAIRMKGLERGAVLRPTFRGNLSGGQ